MTFHDTRHEATTRLSSTLHILALAAVTGHRDIKELMTYYDESAEDIAKVMNKKSASKDTVDLQNVTNITEHIIKELSKTLNINVA